MGNGSGKSEAGSVARSDPRSGMRISTRLFLSYVAVLLIAVVVAFAASEAVTPFMMRLHERHEGRMGAPMHGGSWSDTRGPMMPDLAAEYGRVTQQSMLIGLAAGLIVAAALSIWLSRRITAPLRDMHNASERIAEGSYAERLDEAAPGEVGELAAAFNRMAAELEATEARRSSLIGNVAHEFRTPLTSLRGYIEGIADGHFAADPDVMASCTRQVSRLRSLVDDLSLLSRVEAGVEPVEPRSISLGSLFEQARSDLAGRFEEQGVTLEVDVRLDAGPTAGGEGIGSGAVGGGAERSGAVHTARVHADPDRTLQVIENLLTNALRHTPAGGTVSLSAHRGPGDFAVVSVADTGEGIPEEAAPHVFERFYRADRSRARQTRDSGTGIGLTVAKAFVEAQGGRIWIQESSPAGTVIQFSIPSL